MVQNSYLILFMPPMVFYIKNPVLKHLNKMGGLKENINTYLIITTPTLHNKSPYQLFHNSIPDMSLFKVFGSLCFATTLTSHQTKHDPRARKSVFLGYKSGYKGYVLYDLSSREIFISRHVTFHEHVLPYPSSTSNPTSNWDYVPSNHSPAAPISNSNDTNVPPLVTTSSDTTVSTSSPSSPPNPTSSHRRSTRPKQIPP
ncbi:retrovirus-related Pol polyprotein from transposon TNT 1-94 [Trifolium pratense]|uniref:Retrovirus-related Pol polyprotein from transposon TNT 1-94 n=1 Tax=Trifolium pratense TaxID=57577 RepID=A0A2K3NR19_TRIPR|nr:retrovirus-related Pol polyprotein from transposon TNT 1-94 [Trifolium pratense]